MGLDPSTPEPRPEPKADAHPTEPPRRPNMFILNFDVNFPFKKALSLTSLPEIFEIAHFLTPMLLLQIMDMISFFNFCKFDEQKKFHIVLIYISLITREA